MYRRKQQESFDIGEVIIDTVVVGIAALALSSLLIGAISGVFEAVCRFTMALIGRRGLDEMVHAWRCLLLVALITWLLVGA
jgi:Tfp pilus assembly protein PilV